MAVAFPPPLVPIAGASDREGRSRRNRHHWIAPSRGIIPISLILIIAAPQGFNIVPFSGSLQYGNARPIQADDGSGRGPARGRFRWAKASVLGRVWRPPPRRASSARGPSPTRFGVLGLTRARQSCLTRQPRSCQPRVTAFIGRGPRRHVLEVWSTAPCCTPSQTARARGSMQSAKNPSLSQTRRNLAAAPHRTSR